MIAELSKYGIDVRPGSIGDVKVVCPKCSHTRRNKKDPCLSVNVDTGVWNCHHCDFHGKVKKMKEYNRPTVELKTLSEPVIKWFAARGISNQTLLRYRITEGKEWIPQVDKEVNCIKFVYYDEFNEVANIKFRDRDKNFKMVSGARLLPYGMDVCADNSSDMVAVVEGEADVLACYEAGIKYAVSVPNGASKGSQKLEWLEECIDFFEGKKIYIATDMDEPGRSLKEELARRLGKENCYDVTLPKKDSNEVLVHLGPEVLAQCFREARPFPLDGIEALTTSEMLTLYDEGVPQGCNVGWSNMDEHFKWHAGMVTLITGIPGHGKTTFLKNIITRLASLHHWKFMVYSAEEASAKFAITEIMSIKSGKAFFYSPLAPRIGREEIAQLTPWVDDHFKYYNLDEQDGSIENIMKAADAMVRVHGINGLIIDNMSTVERGIRGSGDSRHNEIGNMMRDLRSWARKRGVHVFLVAHPKKMSKVNGAYEVPTGYDVGDCYSQDTEVLTEFGWKFHNEWSGERIAMFNLSTGAIEFDYPEKLNSFDYEGVMHHYESKMVDILVSPNHKMVIKPNWSRQNRTTYTGDWELKTSSVLSGSGFKIPSYASFNLGSDEVILSGYNNVDLAELCGYYTSEGTVSKNSISFSQAPGDVLERMVACFDRMNLDYNLRIKKDKRGYKDSVIIRLYKRSSPTLVDWVIKNCGQYSFGVKVPDVFLTSSVNVREAYLNAHIAGDGCITGVNITIDTTSKFLSDGLQCIATSLGYRARVTRIISKNRNHRNQYCVRLRRFAPDYHINIADYRKDISYNGKIYCFTTRTGAYVTRRNGKVAFQGNSSNYYNAPDNGITVYRRGDQTEVHFWKVRFWWSGSLGTDHFKYKMGTSEFYEANQLNDGSSKAHFKNQPLTKGDIDKFIGAGTG